MAGFPVMEWKPRLVEPDEIGSVVDMASVFFGFGPKMPEAYAKEYKLTAEPDRIFVVEDDATLAGTVGAYSLELAMPGGAVPMCGVTWAGVLPTHRRRGILSAIMGALLDQAIERGEPLAGLTASEGGIYRRFGYGVAARFQSISVVRARSTELVDPRIPGRLRLITEEEATTLLPAVWEQHRLRRVGEVTRSAGWWQAMALDPEQDRDGASPRYLVAHEDADGSADGFAIYRMKEGNVSGSGAELRVEEIAAADDRVEAALLRYLLDVDLVTTLSWDAAPVDLPLRWRLADPRAIRVTSERDHLWLRPLDVAGCLTARTYVGPGDGAVIEVVDEARPGLGGRFLLDAGADGAECTRTTTEPDVVVSTPDLGALLLGGVSWRTLQRAGLVDERTLGTVDRLDALFRPTRAPFCATGF